MEKLGNFNGGKTYFKCFLRVNYLTFCNSVYHLWMWYRVQETEGEYGTDGTYGTICTTFGCGSARLPSASKNDKRPTEVTAAEAGRKK